MNENSKQKQMSIVWNHLDYSQVKRLDELFQKLSSGKIKNKEAISMYKSIENKKKRTFYNRYNQWKQYQGETFKENKTKNIISKNIDPENIDLSNINSSNVDLNKKVSTEFDINSDENKKSENILEFQIMMKIKKNMLSNLEMELEHSHQGKRFEQKLFECFYWCNVNNAEKLKLYKKFIDNEIGEKKVISLYKDWEEKSNLSALKLSSGLLRELPFSDKKNLNDKFIYDLYGRDPEIWNLVRLNITDHEKENSYIKAFFALKNINNSVININLDELIIKEKIKKYDFSQEKTSYSPKVHVLALNDIHLGKLGRSDDGVFTSLQNDLDGLEDVLRQFLTTVNPKKQDHVVLPIGQDFFQCDSINNTTTAGTVVSVNENVIQVFNEALPLLINFIQELLNREVTIHCFYSPGNHDQTISGLFTAALYNIFKNNENFIKETERFGDKGWSDRHLMKIGNVGIMYLHGDKPDFKKAESMLLSPPIRKFFGNVSNMYIFSGHLHGINEIETFGIIKIITSSPSSTDAWHYTNGYIGNVKQVQSFTMLKSTGSRIRNDYLIPFMEHLDI